MDPRIARVGPDASREEGLAWEIRVLVFTTHQDGQPLNVDELWTAFANVHAHSNHPPELMERCRRYLERWVAKLTQ